MIKQIECKGTPYEIGLTHGTSASEEITRSIDFYASLFQKTSNRDWSQVTETANTFASLIQEKWPRYYDEMKGIADGSNRDVLDIVALNVRTEIAFGQFSDGCTSLFWHTPNHEWLGQNWDWQKAQAPNLIALTIHQSSLPSIKMITEAGIIGKIGLNSAGVGVCLNAIRAVGLDYGKMPVHLGLRHVLECGSTKEAVEKLEEVGMASSAHMLIADGTGDAVGLEFTSSTFARLVSDDKGRIAHSNHLLAKHDGAVEPEWLADSPKRVSQMRRLAEKSDGEVGWKEFSGLFEDENGFPVSICRAQVGDSTIATLFNVVMDLKAKKAVVRMGRPSETEETIHLDFE
ncbi:N-terminal nucleophile aminohydrolases (Ntn hydrolases) [Glarea lozoyensis ATCC 20868]|uniref:N-terminal nucleophile aminohydrolases (Ntn hydrolases) n=1 Tax=Glarea lozoyensis (strain ATCC 20868 / MF5171) TaxID=1116229 RepID=S3EAP9_GLAL2|nr:N-terminal nucleophile aminohydrolases (Ntn hydrolases) [Glarea lozoyensis ATCC 20868]EPE35393.1 N-terminal nucleophile aminohydrolases (Ntn hydrolases) [Glarea lozoyensis ATCC 20868]